MYSTFQYPLKYKQTQHGFSLLELLTVLFISSILVTLSVSIGKKFVAQNRTASTINTLMSGLYVARSEAIMRGEEITFCKSNNQQTCSGDWSDGQIIVTERGEVLRIFSPLSISDKLVWSSSLGRNDSLQWLPTGYTNGQRGSFHYCHANGADVSHSIVVLNTGRLYSDNITLSNYEKHCL